MRDVDSIFAALTYGVTFGGPYYSEETVSAVNAVLSDHGLFHPSRNGIDSFWELFLTPVILNLGVLPSEYFSTSRNGRLTSKSGLQANTYLLFRNFAVIVGFEQARYERFVRVRGSHDVFSIGAPEEPLNFDSRLSRMIYRRYTEPTLSSIAINLL